MFVLFCLLWWRTVVYFLSFHCRLLDFFIIVGLLLFIYILTTISLLRWWIVSYLWAFFIHWFFLRYLATLDINWSLLSKFRFLFFWTILLLLFVAVICLGCCYFSALPASFERLLIFLLRWIRRTLLDFVIIWWRAVRILGRRDGFFLASLSRCYWRCWLQSFRLSHSCLGWWRRRGCDSLMEEVRRLRLLAWAGAPLGCWERWRRAAELVLICGGLLEFFVVAGSAWVATLVQEWAKQGVLILPRRRLCMTSRWSRAFSILSFLQELSLRFACDLQSKDVINALFPFLA